MRMYKSTKTTVTTTTIPSIKTTTTTFVVYLNTKHAAYIKSVSPDDDRSIEKVLTFHIKYDAFEDLNFGIHVDINKVNLCPC